MRNVLLLLLITLAHIPPAHAQGYMSSRGDGTPCGDAFAAGLPSKYPSTATTPAEGDYCSTGDQFSSAAEPPRLIGVPGGHPPRLTGATNGTIGGDATVISGVYSDGTRIITPYNVRKIAELENQLDKALEANDLTKFAATAYKLQITTGLDVYQTLGDVALGEAPPDTIHQGLGAQLDRLKTLCKLKGGQALINTLKLINNHDPDMDAEIAQELAEAKCWSAEEMTPTLRSEKIESIGLRKFDGTLLRVFIAPPSDDHGQKMVTRAVKSALGQLCAATDNQLRWTFARDMHDANVIIKTGNGNMLWYEMLRHSTSTICEPVGSSRTTRVSMRVPTKATMHRDVTQTECEEYCLRELSRAIGIDWFPTSREIFTRDFKSELALAPKSSEKQWSPYIGKEIKLASESAIESVSSARSARGGEFYYNAGMAYLFAGNVAMATRHFCNATELLSKHDETALLVLRRLRNMGELDAAELVAFACMNDMPDNGNDSVLMKEYLTIHRMNNARKGKSHGAALLDHRDASMIAKLYKEPATHQAKAK